MFKSYIGELWESLGRLREKIRELYKFLVIWKGKFLKVMGWKNVYLVEIEIRGNG